MVRLLLLSLLALLLVPGRLGADDSLARAAEKEKARRAGLKGSDVPSYGNEDLPDEPTTASPDAAPAPEAPASDSEERPRGRHSEGHSEGSEDSPDQLVQAVVAARAVVARKEAAVRELELRIKQIRASPELDAITTPNLEQARANQLAQAQRDLETAQQELDQAKQDLDDRLEDARRAGVPPGDVEER